MDFLCYHRDRPGSMTLREELLEQHLSYMDRFADTMVARGPTFSPDGTLTGSVHIVGLPDVRAARAFAFDEPCYQAGAYRDVLLRRWQNTLGGTMWDVAGEQAGRQRYLVLGFACEPATGAAVPLPRGDLISFGPLLSDDAATVLGAAALVEATDADAARQTLDPERYVGIEVHQWRFGGRPG
jgi:uncharacterized protein